MVDRVRTGNRGALAPMARTEGVDARALVGPRLEADFEVHRGAILTAERHVDVRHRRTVEQLLDEWRRDTDDLHRFTPRGLGIARRLRDANHLADRDRRPRRAAAPAPRR